MDFLGLDMHRCFYFLNLITGTNILGEIVKTLELLKGLKLFKGSKLWIKMKKE